MKSIALKTLATGILLTTLLFTGCKKDPGPAGPAGPQGPAGVVTTSTDGFIKGTLTGTRRDGTTFNETFNYQNYWGGASGTLDSLSPGNFMFSVFRGIDVFGANSAGISLSTTSPTASTGIISNFNFYFTKSLGVNKQFYFSVNSGTTGTATAIVYNKTTGLITGNYNMNIPSTQNNTGNSATITGSFQATITKLYYLKKHTEINSN